MLIPYRVDVPMYRWPIANYVLIIAITTAFCFMMSALQSGDFESVAPFVLQGWSIKGLFGHMFLHSGFWHIVGNLLFLWVFGNAVCEKMGNIAYPFTFLGLGVASASVHNLFDGHPAIGASGAINGIVGMFLAWFPTNNISCFGWFWFRTFTFEIASFWMILFWLAFDILGAIYGGGSVAYWAHLGGFGVGFILAAILTKLEWVSIYDDERTVLDIFGLRKSWRQRAAEHAATVAAKPKPVVTPAFAAPTVVAMPQAFPAPVSPPRKEALAVPSVAAPEKIRFKCACGKTLAAPPDKAGKSAKCPACEQIVKVPLALRD